MITPTGVQGVQRTFEIIQKGLDELGVKVTPNALDDTTAFEEILAPDNKYEKFDMAMWSWVGYLDPDFVLSVVTCAQWGGWSDTGYCNPEYDALYKEQGEAVDQESAQGDRLGDAGHHAGRPPLHSPRGRCDYITAWQKNWDGFLPDLIAYSKQPWIAPHQVG